MSGRTETVTEVVDLNKYQDRAEYARIANIADAFERQKALDEFVAEGKRHGVIGIRKLFTEYVRSQRKGQLMAVNVTAFDGQPMELQTRDWYADDSGIYRRDGNGAEVYACPHPIMPVQRLRNVDTGREHMEIAFRRGAVWQRVIVPKSVLASASQIITLADNGVAVTSETARNLVAYLHDVENANYAEIPTKMSVSRLGYVHGLFSPYEPDLVFDGEASYKTLYNAVTEHGNCGAWLSEMRKLRADSVAAKIIIAASFASALVEPLGSLPFFVHLWGSESGTGKTVALMAAASVWGDPAVGKYIQTFHSTVVGHERLAAFLNSLPVIIDELQLAATDSKGEKQFSVYRLAEGVGKARGNKLGGFDRTPTWANTILTSGESPIVGENAAAGTRNRVIEIECTLGAKIVKNGHSTAAALRANYGWGGRAFVNGLDAEEARELYAEYVKALEECASDKQVMAAAVLLVADELATRMLFKDGNGLTVGELADYLLSKDEVDVNRRAYDFLCGWVAQNAAAFREHCPRERLGAFEIGRGNQPPEAVYILRNAFRDVLQRNGYSYKSVQAWLASRELLKMRGRNYTVQKTIDGVSADCYRVTLPAKTLEYEEVFGNE